MTNDPEQLIILSLTVDSREFNEEIKKQIREAFVDADVRFEISPPTQDRGAILDDIAVSVIANLICSLGATVIRELLKALKGPDRNVEELKSSIRDAALGRGIVNYELTEIDGWVQWKKGVSDVVKVIVQDRTTNCYYAIYIQSKRKHIAVAVVALPD